MIKSTSIISAAVIHSVLVGMIYGHVTHYIAHRFAAENNEAYAVICGAGAIGSATLPAVYTLLLNQAAPAALLIVTGAVTVITTRRCVGHRGSHQGKISWVGDVSGTKGRNSAEAFHKRGAYATLLKHEKRATELEQAYLAKDLAPAKMLLENDADPVIESEKRVTLLAEAYAAGDSQFAELLLKNRADPDTEDESGVPLLAKAYAAGNSQFTELFLKHRAVADIVDEEGTFLLKRAYLAKDLELAKKLLKNGADPNTEDQKGTSLLDEARAAGDQFFQLFRSCSYDCDTDDSGED
ncbi:Ankyrin repeat-containing domain protein [Akanthomyces lecanii RCEF 1005]|uniref:Ankyrin repeat-containing domain protein n=1 Tax=Akanthomyces lecanii RCEF 1005 TaxID=1081108 RepID=A0A167W219_CORDF|nr:Ankyrin repeat-containing domain protein [Akanthomyces lecanii RCEF 1005]